MSHQTKRFLEELSALLLLAGGRRFEPEELFNMSLGEAFEIGLPNGVSFRAFPLNSHPIFGGIRNDW